MTELLIVVNCAEEVVATRDEQVHFHVHLHMPVDV
jgi:hypothetical protein